MIGKERHLPYQRPPLSKEFLSGEATLLKGFIMKSKEFFDQNEVDNNLPLPKLYSIDRNKQKSCFI